MFANSHTHPRIAADRQRDHLAATAPTSPASR